jgi:hypothetical protein
MTYEGIKAALSRWKGQDERDLPGIIQLLVSFGYSKFRLCLRASRLRQSWNICNHLPRVMAGGGRGDCGPGCADGSVPV